MSITTSFCLNTAIISKFKPAKTESFVRNHYSSILYHHDSFIIMMVQKNKTGKPSNSLCSCAKA